MTQSAFDDETDKPLDAEAERVRRRLVRFMVINLAILFVAVMAVLGAIVYKANVLGKDEQKAAATVPSGPLADGTIALPAGARVLAHDLFGNRLALRAQLAGGGQAVFIYDMAEQKIVARYVVSNERPSSVEP